VLDDSDYDLRGDEDLDGTLCYRIESRPRPRRESQYSKIIFW